MIVKHIRFAVLLLLASIILHAGQITITGQYLDKKNNPIAGASVEYFANIAQLDSTSTDENGNFMLTINTVGIETETLPDRFYLGQNYPNPFNPETHITVDTPYPATMTIFNIRGQYVDKIKIPIGSNDIIWGGLDRYSKPVAAGIYILYVEADDFHMSKRLTLLDGGSGSRLRIAHTQTALKSTELSKANTVDEIHFIKPNTTIKVIQLTTITQDTSLGIITGNVGPTILQTIPYDSCYADQDLSWNLNTNVLNDGDNRFSLKDTAEFYFQYYPHILHFQSGTAGIYSTTLYITDGTDPVLKDSMQVSCKALDGGSPATLPFQYAEIPDTVINQGDTLFLDMLLFVNDGRWPDICGYGIDSLPHATFINELNEVRIISEPGFYGTIDSIVIWVRDMAHGQRVYLKPFSLTVNAAPQFTGHVEDFTIFSNDGQETYHLDSCGITFTDPEGDDFVIQSLYTDTLWFLIFSNYGKVWYLQAYDPDPDDWYDPNFFAGMQNVRLSAVDEHGAIGYTNYFDVNLYWPPEQIQPLPDIEMIRGDSLFICFRDYIEDKDDDTLAFASNTDKLTITQKQDSIAIVSTTDYIGYINDVIITVSDGVSTLNLNPIDILIKGPNDEPVQIQEVPDQEMFVNDTLQLLITEYAIDLENKPLTGSLLANPNVNSFQVGDTLYIVPLADYIGTLTDIVIVIDNGISSVQLNPIDILVRPLNIVTFILKDFKTDTTLISNTSTFWIDTKLYTRTGGILTVGLQDGTYEFNATNPNTIDGKYNLEDYLFLRRPGEIENFEQRSGPDNSSPIIITQNDTILAYKIMSNFPMSTVVPYLNEDWFKGTVRFGPDDLQAPAWWNMNYDPPTDIVRENVLAVINDHIPKATLGKLNLQYIESNTRPTGSVLELGMDSSFPGPGTNFTGFDDNNCILYATSRWPLIPNMYTTWIEILQAIGDLPDLPTDPPIVSYTPELGPHINELGQNMLGLLYFVLPNTYFTDW